MSETIFSGIQPSGHLTLGNYLGALRRFVELQSLPDTTRLFAVVDLHAMTVEHSPVRLANLTREVATLYLAAGLDPARCVLFRQSDVLAHTAVAYLLECTAKVGELSRMIQYKEKGRDNPSVRASLLTYPVLMAADILVYRATQVPVGNDQAQHVELARDLAQRFDRAYGDVFVLPRLLPARTAARVMNLADPRRKMSKDEPDDAVGVIRVLDPPDVVRRKVMRAMTDTGTEIAYDPEHRPGVSNLLDILAALTGVESLAGLASEYRERSGGGSYAVLKRDVADAVVGALEPVRKTYADLTADPGYVEGVLADGARRATELAAPTLRAAREAMGVG